MSTLLDFRQAADLATASVVLNATWRTLLPDQTFTVAPSGSDVLIMVGGNALVGFDNIRQSAGGGDISSRLILDSGGSPLTKVTGGNQVVANGSFPVVGNWVNVLSGSQPTRFPALAAGGHTVGVQVFSSATPTMTMYCRVASLPNSESLYLSVWQIQP